MLDLKLGQNGTIGPVMEIPKITPQKDYKHNRDVRQNEAQFKA